MILRADLVHLVSEEPRVIKTLSQGEPIILMHQVFINLATNTHHYSFNFFHVSMHKLPKSSLGTALQEQQDVRASKYQINMAAPGIEAAPAELFSTSA